MQRVMVGPSPGSGLLSALLARRSGAWLVLGLGLLLLADSAWGVPRWFCPFAELTGVPCPGCGMTRAVLAGLRGEVGPMLELHAFAPVVMVLIAALCVAAAGPARLRARLLRAVARCERRRVPGVMLVLALLYWVARLVA